MANTHKSTRVGDLFVEKGVITRAQLLIAIGVQQARRHEAQQHGVTPGSKQELGELLIELGFINRQQLTSGLSLQKRLRKTTTVMVFLAPLLTAACGGGGGGGSNTTPSRANTESSLILSSAAVEGQSSLPASSSAPVALSSSSSSTAKSAVNGPVQVYWIPPNQRENGEYLDITEIGGYELRYRKRTEQNFTRIFIKDGYIDAYYFDNLQGEYEFQIAAFDTQGHYSSFETLFPM